MLGGRSLVRRTSGGQYQASGDKSEAQRVRHINALFRRQMRVNLASAPQPDMHDKLAQELSYLASLDQLFVGESHQGRTDRAPRRDTAAAGEPQREAGIWPPIGRPAPSVDIDPDGTVYVSSTYSATDRDGRPLPPGAKACVEVAVVRR